MEQELFTFPEHRSSPPAFSWVRVVRSLVLRVCLLHVCVYRCLSFSFDHCRVCPVLLRFTDFDCKPPLVSNSNSWTSKISYFDRIFLRWLSKKMRFHIGVFDSSNICYYETYRIIMSYMYYTWRTLLSGSPNIGGI